LKTLLLLVDLQEDFLAEPGLRPHRARVEAGVLRLLKECRRRAIQVAHVHMAIHTDPDNRMEHWKNTGRWSCVTGSPGAASPLPLEKGPQERLFFKSTFSAFTGTGLSSWLLHEGVNTLWIAGLHWHTCIRQTALDAYQLGLHVVLCQDALGSTEPLQAAQSRIYLGKRGIPCRSTPDLLSSGTPSEMRASEIEKLVRLKVTSVLSARTDSSYRNKNKRIHLLQKTAGRLLTEKDSLADLITAETGKPVRMSREEVLRAADLLNAVAGRMTSETEEEKHIEGMIRYIPQGLIGLITPWNNPLSIPAGQIAAALAYDNGVIWKPSPRTIKTARTFQRLLIECGWPEHLIELLEGSLESGLCLASHPEVNAVSFTGSCEAGWMLAAVCHERACPYQAEMGGNNGVIVWPEIEEPESAARMLAEAAFGFAGQRCTAVRRVILPEAQMELWLGLLQKSILSLSWDSPEKEETIIGPLCSREKAAEVAELLERSRPGLRAILQPHLSAGKIPAEFVSGSAYYPPTLVVCSDPQHELVSEETFGPVLVLQPARNFDHALELLNGVRQGLTAGLLGGDPVCQELFKQKAQAGILKIGKIQPGAALDLPFGGWKDSGYGPPQHGSANQHFYTKMQTIYN
jgi:alpha-ketoglutaric semialdehyde dehydrogenase